MTEKVLMQSQALTAGKCDSFHIDLGTGNAATRSFCNLYPHVSLETVSIALKLTQKCYLHYHINIFS